MRVVALVESEDHVCCRYRLAAFREPFASAGHQLDVRPLPSTTFGRFTIGRGLDEADAVIVQRKLLPRWAIALLRRRARKLIFDFDDALWLRDSYAPQGFDDPKRLRRFRATIAACDLVVAGNDFLAAEAAKYTAPDRVVVIPTCVEPAKYPVLSRASRDGLRLVWVGSQSTLQGLERFTQTLSAIGRAVPGTRLKLICDRFLTIPDLPVEECAWREETEPQEIASADVGISWIPDDPWSRGKCGLKVLQYQAAGLPVIANPVGVHVEMVRPVLLPSPLAGEGLGVRGDATRLMTPDPSPGLEDSATLSRKGRGQEPSLTVGVRPEEGATGFAATSTEEWVSAVARLAADAVLREQMGRAGRRQVEECYSVAAGARRWLAALARLAEPLRKSG